MNWLYLFGFVTALGPIMIALGNKPLQLNEEPPMIVQGGYLALIIGLFGVLSQFWSFGAVMLLYVVASGAIWLFDRLVLEQRRNPEVREPVPVEYAKGFFPIILFVFLLRSFIAEPFQIPSSSMRPGLTVGDFILVNKFAYGLRTPVINNVLVPVGLPQRGDVMVFHFPGDDRVDYIKRVVGTPGDKIEYRDKRLTINGSPVSEQPDGTYEYLDEGDRSVATTRRFTEQLGKVQHSIAVDETKPTLHTMSVLDFPHRDQCTYDDDGFVCTVPAGEYFMMGDNRDHSADSRYWGFVPERNIVGKAFLVWMNLSNLKRVGTLIK